MLVSRVASWSRCPCGQVGHELCPLEWVARAFVAGLSGEGSRWRSLQRLYTGLPEGTHSTLVPVESQETPAGLAWEPLCRGLCQRGWGLLRGFSGLAWGQEGVDRLVGLGAVEGVLWAQGLLAARVSGLGTP